MICQIQLFRGDRQEETAISADTTVYTFPETPLGASGSLAPITEVSLRQDPLRTTYAEYLAGDGGGSAPYLREEDEGGVVYVPFETI